MNPSESSMWGGGSGDSLESMVTKVKELQRSGPAAKEQWVMYTSAHGGGTRDPSKHTAEFLQGFVDSYTSGHRSMPSGGGPSAWVGGEDSVDFLVGKVKDLQRSDPKAKEQWIAFTDMNGAGTRDPSKHAADFLQGFLDHYSSGHQIMPGAAGGTMENPTLSEAIKMMQKRSENFKNTWKQFCTTQGGGRFDPAKHDTGFHLGFLENLASVACGGSGASMMMGASESPAKRMRDSSGMGMGMPSGGGGGGSAKEALVNRMKTFQRMGQEHKDLWAMYADTYLEGVRDPSRHDASTLEEFCTNHDVPEYSGPASFGGAPTIPPSKSPSWSGGMGMSGGMSGGMPASTGDPMKDALVQRVKNFQKIAKENAELWRSFCGPTKDPTRHTNDKLQEFCKLFGVP